MTTTNKLDEAAKRRVRAARLLQAGHEPAQVATMVNAPRQTVYGWRHVLKCEGIDVLRDMSQGGRPARLDAELGQLQVALLEDPGAQGFATPLWTIPRVRQLIEQRLGVKYSKVHVWRLLGQLGFSSQKPTRRARERGDEMAASGKGRTWPGLKIKPAAKED